MTYEVKKGKREGRGLISGLSSFYFLREVSSIVVLTWAAF